MEEINDETNIFMIEVVVILLFTCHFKPVDMINGVERFGCDIFI